MNDLKIKEKISEIFKRDKKLCIIVTIGIIGILLIALSELPSLKNEVSKVKSPDTEQNISYEKELEARLTKILSEVDGAGKVSVMVTLYSQGVSEFATNSTADVKSQQDLSQEKTENEYVIIDGVNGDECVALRSTVPEVQGVVVVCSGGDNGTVKNNITNAVSDLLGISTSSVTVIKMKNTEESQ